MGTVNDGGLVMLLVLGTRLLGRVHVTPRGAYVATRFLHVCFLPLLPLGSYVVKRSDILKFEGVPIGAYRTSVVTGYLRGWLAAGILLLPMGLAFLIGNRAQRIPPEDRMFATAAAVAGTACALGLIATYSLRSVTTAGPELIAWMTELLERADKEWDKTVREQGDAPRPHPSTPPLESRSENSVARALGEALASHGFRPREAPGLSELGVLGFWQRWTFNGNRAVALVESPDGEFDLRAFCQNLKWKLLWKARFIPFLSEVGLQLVITGREARAAFLSPTELLGVVDRYSNQFVVLQSVFVVDETTATYVAMRTRGLSSSIPFQDAMAAAIESTGVAYISKR